MGSKVKTTCICPYYINTGMFKGAKSRFPILLPFLDQHWITQRIVNAVLQDEQLVITPNTVVWNFLIRAILPVSWFDAVHDFLGTSSGMDEFVGRHESN